MQLAPAMAVLSLLVGLSAAAPAAMTTGKVAEASKLETDMHHHILSLLEVQGDSVADANVSAAVNVSLVPLLQKALDDMEQEDPEVTKDDGDIKLLINSLAAAKEGGVATPGMMKFVAKVNHMIDKDMTVKIRKGHRSGQRLIYTMLRNFQKCKAGKRRADQWLRLANARSRSSSIYHKRCRRVEARWWNLKTSCSNLMRAKARLMKSECDAMRLLRRDPNKEADSCHAARNERYGSWLARNYRQFRAKEIKYLRQKGKCDRAKADYLRFKPKCMKKIRIWKSRKGSCYGRQKQLEGRTCTAAKFLIRECDNKYVSCYEDALAIYRRQVPILRKQERDRKVEWRALMRIKCLLGVFSDKDGAVSSNTIERCRRRRYGTRHLNLRYGRIPGRERCQAVPNTPCSSPWYNQEYRRLPRRARAGRCSLCVLYSNKNGFPTRPIYHLKARNYHPGSNTWRNMGNRGGTIRGLWRYGNRPWVRSYKGWGAQRPVTAMFGTWRTGLYFGNIFPHRYTICSLTRYTGGRRGRILNGGHVNWLHGHWSNRAGIAYYSGWKTSSNNRIRRHNWLAMCGRNGGSRPMNFIANGVPIGRRGGGSRPPYMAVNFGHYGNERSDFAIAEIVIFQETLTNAGMARVSQYLLSTLRRKKPLKPNPRYTTRALPCTGPQLSVLDPGTSSSRSFRCNDGRCISLEGRCNKVKNCRDGSDERGCGKKKSRPNPKYRSPARQCTTRQRLRLKKGRGDSSAFRCRDGTCIRAMGRCNGFKNCNDGSDEKYCPKRRRPKSVKKFRKIGQVMVVKYTNKWPHCTNLRCFGNVPVNWAKKQCLRDRRCDGFSFTRAAFRRGRGHGCLKRACKNDRVKGYGKGAYGYIEKRRKIAGPRCQDLMARYTQMWRLPAVGLDLSAYMSGPKSLRWIGQRGSNGKYFYCRNVRGGIQFGSRYAGRNGRATVRALLGGKGVPPSYSGCCSKGRPTDVCNAPNEHKTIREMCKDLGYSTGRILAYGYNGCPAVRHQKGSYGSTFKPPPNNARIGARFECKGRLSHRWVYRFAKFSRSMSWLTSYKFARRRGGHLLQLAEAQRLIKARGAIWKGGDWWAATFGRRGIAHMRDFVQAGDKVHKPGISHVKRFGFPKWGNTEKGKEAKVLIYKIKRSYRNRFYKRR